VRTNHSDGLHSRLELYTRKSKEAGRDRRKGRRDFHLPDAFRRLSPVRFPNPVQQVQSARMDYVLDLPEPISAFKDFTPYTPFREIGS
jgi:hypothetical protein